ncbi:hypothetical protein ACAG24_026600 [Mycobacterium sp. pW049]|uniref:hypothetical protein n=1 Tax=[Mycobacterium] bulgaricum TaxID=3238985 RepID=UPI00351B9CC4
METMTCPKGCGAEAEIHDHQSFGQTFGGRQAKPDRLTLVCPNCGQFMHNLPAN